MIRSLALFLFCVIYFPLQLSAQQFIPMLPPAPDHLAATRESKAAGDAEAVKYFITLEINTLGKHIDGYATIDLAFSNDASTTAFDLTSQLTVDSVYFESAPIAFTHADSKLTVTWPRLMKANEEAAVTVYYNGKPEQDQSWGGFIFSGNYAFNLGVGFSADPHTYGRAWFPCFDNFTDRATYEFKIITTSAELAQCNGSLVARTDLGNGQTEHHWEMHDPIPTYLASVAVAPYTELISEHNGIPIRLSALKADSANMAASFENLTSCIDAYIDRYGPHTFERIGFNLVPFNGGAMEHATNIAYPIFGAKGDKNFETLWAHELAHHWWGNTVTCADQSEMWINEGWASYSEKIFLEDVYGRNAYDNEVASNHLNVLRFAHWRDGDTLAISGVDHGTTYGMHVYNKGADVAHTLRGYMGDSAFFAAIASFIDTYRFTDVTSEMLRDHFQLFTSADLDAFFNNWVFSPGFPHFDVLSVESTDSAGMFRNKVKIRQRTRFAPSLYENVPLMLTAYDGAADSINIRTVVSGFISTVTFTSDFEPVMTIVDREQLISDATTSDQFWATEGTKNLANGMMILTVNSAPEPTLIRVEHNWVRPDDYFTTDPLPVLSRERYWKVDGIWKDGFRASARIYYDGRMASGTSGGLDVNLIRQTEDSLVLMYREGPDKYWREYEHYTKTMGSSFDKFGFVTLDELQKGEYAFAMYHAALLSSPAVMADERSDAFPMPVVVPNPADDTVSIYVEDGKGGKLEITDAKGQLVHSVSIRKKEFSYTYDVSNLPPGIYFAGVLMNDRPYNVRRFIVRR